MDRLQRLFLIELATSVTAGLLVGVNLWLWLYFPIEPAVLMGTIVFMATSQIRLDKIAWHLARTNLLRRTALASIMLVYASFKYGVSGTAVVAGLLLAYHIINFVTIKGFICVLRQTTPTK